MKSRRGESLVEVVVALGIIMFIFAGAVNIIANAITLNASARTRTEAVAKVQKNLNEYLASLDSSGQCSVTPYASLPTTIYESTANCSTSAMTEGSATCYWVKVVNISSTEVSLVAAYGLNTTNFVKVISGSKWYTRVIGEQKFEAGRIVGIY